MCLSGKGIESPSQGQLSGERRAILRCLHSTTRPPQPAVTMQHRGARRCSADHLAWRAANIDSSSHRRQAEQTLVLARASGPIPQAATCRLRAVLVAAVLSRARRKGGTLRFYRPYPVAVSSMVRPGQYLKPNKACKPFNLFLEASIHCGRLHGAALSACQCSVFIGIQCLLPRRTRCGDRRQRIQSLVLLRTR